ncbi:flagellar biosynthetic protein FliR [Rickettsia endosymbiont of Cardiosporidium cionae]|uniref:flagellar biosynthetic protein FliR n=1 Tax=Rickettsia endosymbiont of Cardiosporidium cionae TaxID=2777155 RepID=UPI001895E752|nr:flagellar biosynthetic protein FliR [Rickettsia endosymbiont of Cardiosporidium cionae]
MLEREILELIYHFLLVLTRVGAAISNFYVMNNEYLLKRHKLLIMFTFTIVLLPNVVVYLPKYQDNILPNLGYLALEFFIGIVISITSRIIFSITQFIDHLISTQSSLGASLFFDPHQRIQKSLFSNFFILYLILVIMISDIHHIFLYAIAESYKSLSILHQNVQISDIGNMVAEAMNQSFLLAFKICAPIIILSGVLLISGAIVSRMIPSFQVFFIFTPVQIMVMFCTVYFIAHHVVMKLADAIKESFGHFTSLY